MSWQDDAKRRLLDDSEDTPRERPAERAGDRPQRKAGAAGEEEELLADESDTTEEPERPPRVPDGSSAAPERRDRGVSAGPAAPPSPKSSRRARAAAAAEARMRGERYEPPPMPPEPPPEERPEPERPEPERPAPEPEQLEPERTEPERTEPAEAQDQPPEVPPEPEEEAPRFCVPAPVVSAESARTLMLGPTAGGPELDPELERCCFICLDGAEEGRQLVPCCSQCYVHVHRACWRSWRQSQRLAHLRTRVLGGQDNAPGVLVCSVCKTGDAIIEGEDLSWLDDTRAFTRYGQQMEEVSLDFTVLCSPKLAFFNLLVLISVVLLNTFVVSKYLFFGQMVFLSIIFSYEFGLLQVVLLALRMRARQASMRMPTRPARDQEGEDDDSPALARDGSLEMLERGNA